ncbi:hypothetical protein BDY21DRAFT_189261 [Lineolata rhizophorae]|uniref:F-box domain-containing protein n=1 Tax=Lineolata rhizophorae TaxID=578093 RepID=A0A6A6P6I4_9PEZI|nr:hypothetical protein BDY21DRAFT_189261 [Lineolata rhizophorae]
MPSSAASRTALPSGGEGTAGAVTQDALDQTEEQLERSEVEDPQPDEGDFLTSEDFHDVEEIDFALSPSNGVEEGSEEQSDVPQDLPTEMTNGVGKSAHASLSRLLKGKEKEWSAVTDKKEKKGPLRLLDLPVEILKEIINQLPHSNDLTSLARCHSVLHSLTVPSIYARFDIVWPDQSTHTDTRPGVDALTYGLSTLVRGEEFFGENIPREWTARRAAEKRAIQQSSGLTTSIGPGLLASRPPPESSVAEYSRAGIKHYYPLRRRRYGNSYAMYTKKFSLGNGPTEWVQEYLISKESGKMLGTLVALAIARMRNLESFVWDMPTGVLRDVWLSLGSLADRDDALPCKLKKVWVRFHDNSSLDANSLPSPPPPIPTLAPMPPPPPPPPGTSAPAVTPHISSTNVNGAAVTSTQATAAATAASQAALDRIEHPNFSVLPALESISALDVDELPNLDELSVLVARSQDVLRELRIGIARQTQGKDWVQPWEGDAVQVDYGEDLTGADEAEIGKGAWPGGGVRYGVGSRAGEKRLGGILGVIVGRVYNMRWDAKKARLAREELANSETSKTASAGSGAPPVSPLADSFTSMSPHTGMSNASSSPEASAGSSSSAAQHTWPLGPPLRGKLRLHTLELERVPLAVSVMQKAIDWTQLTSLTLLHCQNHEQLWKALKKTYTPKESDDFLKRGGRLGGGVGVGAGMGTGMGFGMADKAIGRAQLRGANGARPGHAFPKTAYPLALKKVHTNTVSNALISFLKETLAPNSLEVLFLQEGGRFYSSSVPTDAIFRGPIRRHSRSLTKLLIDSGDRDLDGGLTTGSTRWRRWMLRRTDIEFLTSGRMARLRELGACLEYRDWHFFLQSLPNLPHLRSLYVPHIADHAHGNNIDARELALQIVDIIHLRPEIELCYMGVQNKCFELLENKPRDWDSARGGHHHHLGQGHGHHHHHTHTQANPPPPPPVVTQFQLFGGNAPVQPPPIPPAGLGQTNDFDEDDDDGVGGADGVPGLSNAVAGAGPAVVVVQQGHHHHHHHNHLDDSEADEEDVDDEDDATASDDASDEDDTADEEEEDEDDEDVYGYGGDGDGADEDGEEDDGASYWDSDDSEAVAWQGEVRRRRRQGPKLRLREILFYDDKVEVFKARHGRL